MRPMLAGRFALAAHEFQKLGGGLLVGHRVVKHGRLVAAGQMHPGDEGRAIVGQDSLGRRAAGQAQRQQIFLGLALDIVEVQERQAMLGRERHHFDQRQRLDRTRLAAEPAAAGDRFDQNSLQIALHAAAQQLIPVTGHGQFENRHWRLSGEHFGRFAHGFQHEAVKAVRAERQQVGCASRSAEISSGRRARAAGARDRRSGRARRTAKSATGWPRSGSFLPRSGGQTPALCDCRDTGTRSCRDRKPDIAAAVRWSASSTKTATAGCCAAFRR